jgi:hypothetical protein
MRRRRGTLGQQAEVPSGPTAQRHKRRRVDHLRGLDRRRAPGPRLPRGRALPAAVRRGHGRRGEDVVRAGQRAGGGQHPREFDPSRTTWTKAGEPFLREPGTARRELAESANLFPRLGQPANIAQAAVHLASDESAWVTGQRLAVDGGYLVSGAAGLPEPEAQAVMRNLLDGVMERDDQRD